MAAAQRVFRCSLAWKIPSSWYKERPETALSRRAEWRRLRHSKRASAPSNWFVSASPMRRQGKCPRVRRPIFQARRSHGIPCGCLFRSLPTLRRSSGQTSFRYRIASPAREASPHPDAGRGNAPLPSQGRGWGLGVLQSPNTAPPNLPAGGEGLSPCLRGDDRGADDQSPCLRRTTGGLTPQNASAGASPSRG